MANSDGTRVECRWKPLRQGEMSPFKMLVALLMREVYVAANDGKKGTDERPISLKTLLLMHKLVNAYDLDTFQELKTVLENPKHCIRPEALKKFFRITSNLEPNNSYFLYELANSLVTMEASQMIVLKKKITKNSPFGKFLTGIYLNIKKLSYPQVNFMYKHLLNYLIVETLPNTPSKIREKEKSQRSFKGLELFQKLEEGHPGGGLNMELFNKYLIEYRKMTDNSSEAEQSEFKLYQDRKIVKSEMATDKAASLRQLWKHPKPRSATLISAQTPCSGGQISSPEKIDDSPQTHSDSGLKRITRSSSSPITKGTKRRSSSLRRIYFSSPRPSNSPMATSSPNIASSSSMGTGLIITPISPGRTTRSSVAALNKDSNKTPKFTPSAFSPSPLSGGAITCTLESDSDSDVEIRNTGAVKVYQKFSAPTEREERKEEKPLDIVDDEKDTTISSLLPYFRIYSDQPNIPNEDTKKTPNKSEHRSSGKMKMDILSPKSPRGSRRKIEPTTPECEFDLDALKKMNIGCSPPPSVKSSQVKLKSRSSKGSSLKSGETPMVGVEEEPTTHILRPCSKKAESQDDLVGWDLIKKWSRRQVERAVKSLINRLYCANAAVPSPAEITRFVRLALRSPSAHVLYPHLHYLEYLNCLRIKDVTRCNDALRASFDVRIKPNTAELNKGTTYAAYNFALFYNQLGYMEDAFSSLDEAFRAGHAAGDATCLHHCHNLWSSFHGKAYTDAIVTVTKEVDNNMAYLHSLNVIVNAFDVHTRGVAPDEVLHSLWHYNADCDLEEMEGLLLSALANFFTIFGWHEMIVFPTQMILFANWKWSSRFYTFALSALSSCLLYHGDLDASTKLMEYGNEIFGLDASAAGESFMQQFVIFKAMKTYLSCKPVENDVLASIVAFDKMEGVYWFAYNKIFKGLHLDASTMLRRLITVLENKKQRKNYMGTDLVLRCLLMLAELECLNKNPSGALSHLSHALEIATTIHSDVYITWCMLSIASVQCELGLIKTSYSTVEKELRSTIRSGSPWMKAKMNVVKAKIAMMVEVTVTKIQRVGILEKLEWAEKFYIKLGNNYRVKEVLYLKAELLDRSTDLQQSGLVFRKKMSTLQTALAWSPATCII